MFHYPGMAKLGKSHVCRADLIFGVVESFGGNGRRHPMNFEPAASCVEVEHSGHVDHPGVVDVELSHSQYPRQLHPLHEHRRRDVAERDSDADSELDVGFRAHWTLDGQVDGGLGAAVSDH